MSIRDFLVPSFWDHYESEGGGLNSVYSLRRKWRLLFVTVLIITITPLAVLTAVDYGLTRRSLEQEMISETGRSLSNFNQILTSFLDEKKKIADRLLKRYPIDVLSDPTSLSDLYATLSTLDPGIQGIAVYDDDGRALAAAGLPKVREILVQCSDTCLSQATDAGTLLTAWQEAGLTSFDIGSRIDLPKDGSRYGAVRVIQDLSPLLGIINGMVLGMEETAFIVDRKGGLLIHSGNGNTGMEEALIQAVMGRNQASVFKLQDSDGNTLIAGQAFVPGTQWRLVVVSPQETIIANWYRPRIRLVWAFALSMGLLVIVILAASTYIVNHLHYADQRRVMALHQVEYTNKLSSIARLSSGVAHEINNPLAIINEKAGLIKDIFSFQQIYAEDERLSRLIRDILAAVDRCSTVTRRLLNFSRHMETSFSPVNPCQVLREVLLFIRKDAEYRDIEIVENIPEDIPEFYSNHGHLQQIFLNLLQNALVAIGSDGTIEISVVQHPDSTVEFSFRDNGCGIPEKNRSRIFEPFFTTDPGPNSTGLGLSITYGLVREIDGTIHVESAVGKGSTFTIVLPLKASAEANGGFCRPFDGGD